MTDMNDTTPGASAAPGPATRHDAPTPPARRRGLVLAGVAALAILAAGAVGGAGAMRMMGPQVEMAPLTPVAIAALPQDSIVTIKGTVAEIYGNKFVLQDESGRMLVETGRAGEGGTLVAKDQPVTVQGRFDDGFLKASYLVYPDGRTMAIGPARGPHGPGDDHRGPKGGPRGDEHDGPRHERDGAQRGGEERDAPGPQAGPAPSQPDGMPGRVL